LFQGFARLLELGLRQACPFASLLNQLFCGGGHSVQVNLCFTSWSLGRLHSYVPDKSAPT
jgi:hypothetical protein